MAEPDYARRRILAPAHAHCTNPLRPPTNKLTTLNYYHPMHVRRVSVSFFMLFRFFFFLATYGFEWLMLRACRVYGNLRNAIEEILQIWFLFCFCDMVFLMYF